jgi:hypothetical protein
LGYDFYVAFILGSVQSLTALQRSLRQIDVDKLQLSAVALRDYGAIFA